MLHKPNKYSKLKFLLFSFPLLSIICMATPSISYSQKLQSETTFRQTICFQTFNAYGPAYSQNLASRTEVLGEEIFADPCPLIQMQETWSEKHFNLVKNALNKSFSTLHAVHFDKVQSPYVGKSGLSTFSSVAISDTTFEKFAVNQDGLLDRLRGMFGVIKGMGEGLLTITNPVAGKRENKLRTINAHLHPNSIPIRIAQTTQILQKFERLLPLAEPVVLSGDFNFKPESVEYDLLGNVSLFVDSYKEDQGSYAPDVCTYCKENPQHWGGGDRVIDFIWLRSSGFKKLQPSQTIINLKGNGEVIPSDHYGVRTFITIEQQDQVIIEDDLFQERRERALISIEAALNQLQKDRSTSGEFLPTFQTLQRFHQEIRQMDPNSRILQQMLIP